MEITTNVEWDKRKGLRRFTSQVKGKPRSVRFAPPMADHDNIYDDEVIN